MPTYSFLEHLLFPRASLDRRKLGRSIAGKTVLITGASSGIGKRLAYMLAGFDVHLVLVARREDRLAAIKRDLESQTAQTPTNAQVPPAQVQVSVFPADLRDEKHMDSLLAFLHRLPNGLDMVVSNAGHSIRRPIGESLDRYHDFTRTIAVNYLAPVRLLLSVIPLLSARSGHVVNVSTVNALLLPVPRWAAYQASKGAMDIWFRAAAPELSAMGISVTSVYLPLVRTPMILPTTAYRQLPTMSPEHAAEIICRSMYTRRRLYKPWWLIFGEMASVLFGWYWERSASGGWGKKGKSP